MSLLEQRRDFIISKSGDAATDASNEEGEGRVLLGELDKLVHIRTDGFYAALHGGDGIALALQTFFVLSCNMVTTRIHLHTIMKNGLKRHYAVYHIDYQYFNL